jgi:EmrB/QacA subfamily drug resistance transporter
VTAADITIINVALPTIAADLQASVTALQWVVDSYNIMVAGLLLLGAALGERFSRKWVFLGGIALFAAGSLTAGLSEAVAGLIAARTLMGIGGALVLGTAMSLIAVLFPPEQRARAVAAWASAGALGLAVSPIIGGAVLSVADWHWVFLINVPAMLATLALGAVALPTGHDPATRALDIGGALLSVVGLALTLGAVIEAPTHGWTSPVILGALAVGTLTLVLFVRWELGRAQPMLQVRVLRQRGVLAASLGLFGSFLAFNGAIFLVSQELQVTRGVGPFALGLSLVPFAVGLWAMSQRATGVANRWGAHRTLVVGAGLLCLAYAVMYLGSRTDSVSIAILGTVVCSLGCGLAIPIGSVTILNDLPPTLTGSASGLSMLSRFTGASVGVALLGTVLASSLPAGPAHADPAAFDAALDRAYAAGVLMLLGLIVVETLILRRRTLR